MRRSLLLPVAIAVCAWCVVEAAPGIPVVVQFDSSLSRVSSQRKLVLHYLSSKLCRTQPQNVVIVSGKDQSSIGQQKKQSTVTFFCGGDAKKLISSCTTVKNRHQLKDGIQRHTSPVMKVLRIISCGPPMAMDYQR